MLVWQALLPTFNAGRLGRKLTWQCTCLTDRASPAACLFSCRVVSNTVLRGVIKCPCLLLTAHAVLHLQPTPWPCYWAPTSAEAGQRSKCCSSDSRLVLALSALALRSCIGLARSDITCPPMSEQRCGALCFGLKFDACRNLTPAG